MYDIEFYMKACEFRKQAEAGQWTDARAAAALLESFRSRQPFVYNIETTNACNMRCTMCPRTTLMTRPIKTMSRALFQRVIDQLRPFPEETWQRWERFVAEEYGIPPQAMGENHFFLYVIARVIQLHGYGDPLLDPNMATHVRYLTDRGFLSYFSCNPANIDMDRTVAMFESGLSFIKYSIECVDDEKHRQIRGVESDFTTSYERICRLLDLKRQRGYRTTIIITMLDLNRQDQEDDYRKLRAAFAGKDVYIYLKSEDQQWYRKDYHGTKSVHWGEFCKHPWMSMTIKSNGEACMCMEDYNNEIVLGDAARESLADIWNGPAYRKFRQDHFACTPGLKCTEQCDMGLVGELIGKAGGVAAAASGA